MSAPVTSDVSPTAEPLRNERETSDPVQALLREWFVTYNPIYLASAALVLGGLWLVLVDPATRGLLGGHGVSGIAELYAFALIGGAAVLHRTGQRRAAVMLGLLAALYQCDLTLHIETASFLGGRGWLGTLAWIALFPLKLWLLARALELRPSRSALVVPSVGAAVLALLPQVFPLVSSGARGALVALPLFAVAAAALFTSRTIESEAGFDYRGRRAIRGVWLLWAAGALVHVAYWCAELSVSPRLLPVAALLLSMRFAARERTVWVIALGTAGAVLATDPGNFWAAALMASVMLGLRALRTPHVAPGHEPLDPPYRGSSSPGPAMLTRFAAPPVVYSPAEADERRRLLCGVAALLHAGVSMIGTRDVWTPHQPLFDVALVAVCVVWLYQNRRAVSLAPLALPSAHLAVQLGWITRPQGAGAWGAWAIGVGFLLLGTAIAVSWWQDRTQGEPGAAGARAITE